VRAFPGFAVSRENIMPGGSGGRHENMRPWHPAEDESLLQLIETRGAKWKLIAAALNSDRTPAMVRNRYLRIKKGRLLTEQGRSKNRCGVCGQLKRGHICTKNPQPGPSQAAVMMDDDDEEDALSNSSTMLESLSGGPSESVDAELLAVACAEDGSAATPPRVMAAAVAGPSAEFLSAYSTMTSVQAPAPVARVESVKKFCKLERQSSLELLAAAALRAGPPPSPPSAPTA